MTGMSFRIGYRRAHCPHTSSSPSRVTGVLQAGQARISSSSWLIGMRRLSWLSLWHYYNRGPLAGGTGHEPPTVADQKRGALLPRRRRQDDAVRGNAAERRRQQPDGTGRRG